MVNKNINKILITILVLSCLISGACAKTYGTFFIDVPYWLGMVKQFNQSGHNGYGQERDPSEFILNGCGEGTMLDNVTGLCWPRSFTGLNPGFKSNCSPWRHPSIKELQTLVNEFDSTKLWLENYIGFSNVQTEYLSNSGKKVVMETGKIYDDPVIASGVLTCRAGSDITFNYDEKDYCPFLDDKTQCLDNFVIGGCDVDGDYNDDTVFDKGTGLCWMRDFNYQGSSSITWEQAVDFCNNLDYAGRTNWKLPSRQEFFTIIEKPSYNQLSLVGKYSNIFKNPLKEKYWTSTHYNPSQSSNVFHIYLYNGLSEKSEKSNKLRAICVSRS